MHTWAIANQKGGVGKTTTAVSLAGLLAARGAKTLLVDLDPHGSVTSYFGWDPDNLEESVYTLFQRHAGGERAPLASLLKNTTVPGITLMPGVTALATLERQMAGKDGMGLVLAQTLAQCGSRFDYALIDCPPVFGVLMLNALAACQFLVVPVQTDHLALKGLERMLHTIGMVTHSQKRDIEHLIVPTMFDKRTRAAHEGLRVLRSRYAARLWNGVIPIDTRFRDASRQGLPLPTHAPQARGALAYDALLNDIQARTAMENAA